MLSTEQLIDLRKRVLAGERLDLETCKAIVDNKRQGRAASAELAAAGKGRKKTSTKKGMTDAELDADLDAFLGGIPSSKADSSDGLDL